MCHCCSFASQVLKYWLSLCDRLTNLRQGLCSLRYETLTGWYSDYKHCQRDLRVRRIIRVFHIRQDNLVSSGISPTLGPEDSLILQLSIECGEMTSGTHGRIWSIKRYRSCRSLDNGRLVRVIVAVNAYRKVSGARWFKSIIIDRNHISGIVESHYGRLRTCVGVVPGLPSRCDGVDTIEKPVWTCMIGQFVRNTRLGRDCHDPTVCIRSSVMAIVGNIDIRHGGNSSEVSSKLMGKIGKKRR